MRLPRRHHPASAAMAVTAAAAVAVAAVVLQAGAVLGKMTVVGERNETAGYEYAWNPVANYTRWQLNTPLLVGDLAVFEYPRGAEVVWLLANQSAWEKCSYWDAVKLCDSRQAAKNNGKGCTLTITDQPQFVGGRKRQCREQGHKAVILGRTEEEIMSRAVAFDSETMSELFADPVVGPSTPITTIPILTTTPVLTTRSVDFPTAPPANESSPAAAPAPAGAPSAAPAGAPAPAPVVGDDVAQQNVLEDQGVGAWVQQSVGNGNSNLAAVTATGAPGSRLVTVGFPVGDATYAFNKFVNYTAWLLRNPVYIGDSIVFRYPRFAAQVYQFQTYKDWRGCNYARAVQRCGDSAGVAGCQIKMTRSTLFLGTGLITQCRAGQKLIIAGRNLPYTPKSRTVGYPSRQFPWPWNENGQYVAWSKYNRVYAGDSLVFVYPKHMDEVYIVPTLDDYNRCNYMNYLSYCNGTDGTNGGCVSPGMLAGQTTYFVSGFYSHCVKGQKIAITASRPPS